MSGRTATTVVRSASPARWSGADHRTVTLQSMANHRVTVTASGTSVDHGDVAVYAVSDGAQALTIGQAPGEDTLYFTLLPDEEFVPTSDGRFVSAERAVSFRLSRNAIGEVEGIDRLVIVKPVHPETIVEQRGDAPPAVDHHPVKHSVQACRKRGLVLI